jgi:hypothetical protein
MAFLRYSAIVRTAGAPMDLPQPQPIAEGDVVLIRARVRKVWGDSVVVRVLTRNGTAQKWQQLSVPPGVVAGAASPQDVTIVPAVDW